MQVVGLTAFPIIVRIDIFYVGPQIFLSWDKPRYFITFSVHMGCYVVLALVICFLYFYLKRENAKRDRLQEELVNAGTPGVIDDKLVHAFDDLTDKENVNFRYVY